MGSEATTGEKRMITLTSSEGLEFRLTEAAARLSPHLAGMLIVGKGGHNNNVVSIALRNVPGRALRTVIEYCAKHAAAAAAIPSPRSVAGLNSFNAVVKEQLEEWDRELVRRLDDDVDALYDLLMAANFLRLEGLVDAVCQKVADRIKDCETPKRIRETFRIPDDLTAEDKEKIRKEYAWAFGPDDI